MSSKWIISPSVLLAACASLAPAGKTASQQGAILGIARDLDSGEPLAFTDVSARPAGSLQWTAIKGSSNGTFRFLQLAPNTYEVRAHYAGQWVTVSNVPVRSALATSLEVGFHLQSVGDVTMGFHDTVRTDIRKRATTSSGHASKLEGYVVDAARHARVPGAMVLVRSGDEVIMTLACDEDGWFATTELPPGTYLLSTHNTIIGTGDMELRREVTITAGETVTVPMYAEAWRDRPSR